MGRIIKALILGWIGKKIYDRTLGAETEDDKSKPAARTTHHPKTAAAKKSAPKRASTRRAA